MPMPVSVTANSTESFTCLTAMVTVPLSGVNLIALETRLSSICFSLPASASIWSTPSTLQRSAMFFLLTSGSTVFTTWSTASFNDTVWRRSSICPASTLDRSRMSLIRLSRCLPLVRIWPRNRFRVASSNCPSLASVSSSEKPMMALSGVRSS